MIRTKSLFIAVSLALLITAFSPMALAGHLTNTGSDIPVIFEGHVLSGPTGAYAILYAPSESDNAAFRAEVAALTGAVVDYFDARVDTPDAALLADYNCVMTWVNYAYHDSVAMGDNLAGFVDAGGKVILGQWCLFDPTGSGSLLGAVMGPGYCPVTGSFWEGGTYNGDGSECETDGITTLSSDYFDVVTLVPGAVSDGTFNNPSNSLALAWRADRMVYYSPGFTGGTYSTGQWAQLVCNMVECSGGSPVDTIAVALDATPDTGIVPFVTVFTAQLTNLTTERRRVAGKIDVVIANGNQYTNWRAGYTNILSMGTFTGSWSQTMPSLASVIGINTFTLTGEDVTPAPFNQPPYPPSGHIDSAICTVTGILP